MNIDTDTIVSTLQYAVRFGYGTMSVRVFIIMVLAFGDIKSCYWNDKCGYNYFGSKTVYDDVRGDIRDAPKLRGCEPVSVWAMMRHGTRQPSSSNMPNMLDAVKYKDEIVKSHLEGRGELCAQDISNLQSWSWHDLSLSTAGHLTKAGYEQLYQLGTRFHQYFKPLLQELDQFHFRPTLEQRTVESAKAFIEGLAQEYFKFKASNATDVDDVLRPYFYCTKHNVEVYHGERPSIEMSNYHKTKEFQKLLENVEFRAGLDTPLSPTNVTALYDLCRYFRAYSSIKTSPWCALFSSQDLEIMEYLNDLKHYYRNGYGFTINQKLGRPALKDLFDNFQGVVSGSTKSFTGYFSHDSTLQMMYSALGLFRDYPDISGFERIPSRKWRTSTMSPFAANFVAVLHKCTLDSSTPSYEVQFFINEEELHLCSTRTCSWREFQDKFSSFTHNSNLDFCHLNNTSTQRNILYK